MGIFKDLANGAQNTQPQAKTGGIFAQAAAMQNQQPIEIQAEPGFVQSTLQGVASPFLKMYETGKDIVKGTGYLGASLLSKAMGKDQQAQEYLNLINKEKDTAGNYSYFGNVQGIKDVKEAVGVGAELGSYLVGGGVAGSVLKGGAKAVATNIGKTAGFGAIGGGLSGLGIGLQQKDASLGSVLTSTGVGAVAGGALAPIASVASSIAGKLAYSSGIPQKILSKTEAGTKFLTSTIDETKKRVADVYKKSLPLTKTALQKEEQSLARTGDNLFTTLAKNNIKVGSDTAISDLQNISDMYRQASEKAAQNETALFSLKSVRDNAFAHIDENINSEIGRQQAKKKITDELIAIEQANKGKIVYDKNGEPKAPSDIIERLRKTGNDWTPFNASDPERIGASSGYALSNAVRDIVDAEGSFPSYRKFNQEWGKIIHAQEVLNNFEQQGKKFKVVGGFAGSISRKLLSGMIGYQTGGLGNAVLSYLGSETAAELLSNPLYKNFLDQKLIDNAGKKVDQKLVVQLMNEINEFVSKQEKRLKLPAPGQTQGKINLPSEGVLQSQSKIR